MTEQTPASSTPYAKPDGGGRQALIAANPEPVALDLSRSALIVVDMQNDFLHPDGWFPRTGRDTSAALRIVPTIRSLTAALRRVGVPVLWVNWGVRPDASDVPPRVKQKASLNGARPAYGDPSPCGRGRILVAGDWGAETIDQLAPKPGDRVIHKRRFSGFHETELDSVLRGAGTETILFAGINTDRCVFQTLTDAAARGYGCLLVEDACATLSPDQVRDATLYLVRLLHGATCRVDDVTAALPSAIEQGLSTLTRQENT